MQYTYEVGKEGATTNSGIYSLLFGSKPMPLDVSIKLLPDAQRTVIISAAVLAIGAILTAYLLRD